jgi:ATP-binding cassette subfamily F protein 3
MIYLQNLQKQFGSKVLFKDLNFHLRPNEKVGLVGDNGMGKTTLFKVITRMEPLDAGEVNLRKGGRVALLAQEITDTDESIIDRVVMGDRHFRHVRSEMKRLENDVQLHKDSPEKWEKKFGILQHEFERMGGYQREPKGKSILSGLGFRADQWNKPLAEFSGGWRMRVELARLLLENPDVLLLDEPSNHLDLRSVVWLESFLKTYEGSILLISHDRRFLNNIVHRVIELDRGALTVYSGNYDAYERQKKERELLLVAAAKNQDRRIQEIERFIERFRAKNTKATQVQSRVKMLSKMERVQTSTRSKAVHFRFPQPARTGRMVMELSGVDKSYGDVTVYKNFSARLERGYKVALVGENGAGKSTLLKLAAGVIGQDRGEIEMGANVNRAYYAQHHSETLNPEHTVLESLETVAGHLLRTEKHNILGAFLFSGNEVDKKVSVLSGGERSRLALARMLASPASLLLLDEPTNHLDIKSSEFLAAALADYEGTICAISHDRYFLDGIINRVWEVEGGQVKEYLGNYSDYEKVKAEEEIAKLSQAESVPDAGKNTQTTMDRERKRQEAEDRNRRHQKLKPLKSRLGEVEKNLERVMAKKDAAERELADPSIHQAAEKARLMNTLGIQKDLAQEESRLVIEWEELSTSIEELSSEFEKG